ncbi:hypothetical protein JCM6882_005704 [Rhodosporidiobolus microsporus]
MLTVSALLALASLVAAQAPSYAPTRVDCPSGDLIERTGSPGNNQTLAQGEQQYLDNRRANVSPQLWQNYLQENATGSTGYDAMQIVNQQPKLALAVSGGGLRASLYGAGTISALDNRNSSTAGGLLQLADYISGLSGGSWTVTSIALNDMEEIYPMVTGEGSSRTGGWNLDADILAPGGLLSFGDNTDYYDALFEDVRAKADAGFPVSITDIWGRSLTYHFLNGTNEENFFSTDARHDSGTLFSSIRLTTNFQAGAMPFPIVVTTSRVSEDQQVSGQSSTVIPLSNTQFEITPFSFGSFDPTLAARIAVEYMGTQLNNGAPANTSACVNNFENAGFVMGSSASLFNAVQTGSFSSDVIQQLIQTLLSQVTEIQQSVSSIPLIANYPNTFQNWSPDTGVAFESAGNDILQITDGGENGENVPIGPLLVKAREVDIIMAIDSSADTDQTWPNGTSLLATRDRVLQHSRNYTNFPPIPETQQEFVDQGLNVRPTFFGCNSTVGGYMNASGAYPIVIYAPNAPAPLDNPFLTNTTTLTLNYDYDEVVGFLDSAHANALKGFPDSSTPNTPDPQWPLCLKCAVVDRARQRALINRTEACQSCFNRYCWSDDVAEQLVNATETAQNNTPSGGDGSNAAASIMPLNAGGVVASVLAVAAGVALLA